MKFKHVQYYCYRYRHDWKTAQTTVNCTQRPTSAKCTVQLFVIAVL